MNTAHPSLFQPVKIGKLQLKNRLVMAPVGTLFCGTDGHICERLIEYHKIRAKGGWGLIIVEGVAISEQGKGGPKQYGIWDDSFVPEYKRLANEVHSCGAKIALQIMHAGRNTRPEITGGLQPVAPSAIADPIIRVEPKELTALEIGEIVDSFAQAALRTREAGFDAVEIHGGHGYLISEFMSAYANKRDDEYGGDFEGFLRFPVEIIREIKKLFGNDFPLIFRISGNEAVAGGRSVRESALMSARLVHAGADAIHVSVGVYESSFVTMAPPDMEQGFNIDAASKIKSAVPVPVIAVGRIHDPDLAEEIVKTGKADMVAIGRQSLADPQWPLKVAEGRAIDIVRCLSCNEGCLNTAWKSKPVTCVQNPRVGLEGESDILPAGKPRKVIIAGAGPAGLEAARIAARNGHIVTLYEKNEIPGGQMNIASVAPAKSLMKEVIESRIKALDKPGVLMRFGEELTIEIIKRQSPDVLIIATGSEAVVPDIPGINGENVITARQALSGKSAGENIVIIGGGIVGCETADWLSDQGKRVIIVEIMKSPARDVSPASRYFLMKRLKKKSVRIITRARVKGIDYNRVIIECEGAEEILTPADTIILATGSRSVDDLQEEAKAIVPEIHVIGDADSPGKVIDAVKAGFEIGRSLSG